MDFKKLMKEAKEFEAYRQAHPYPLIWIGSEKLPSFKVGSQEIDTYFQGMGREPLVPWQTHYVGREVRGKEHYSESALHNPFTVEQYGRTEALSRYRAYLFAALQEDTFQRAELKRVIEYGLAEKGIVLMCWCIHQYPDCHALIIRKAALHYWQTGAYLEW
jgi:hypothetical protein